MSRDHSKVVLWMISEGLNDYVEAYLSIVSENPTIFDWANDSELMSIIRNLPPATHYDDQILDQFDSLKLK